MPRAFLFLFLMLFGLNSEGFAYLEFEHRYLGNIAYDYALQEIKKGNAIKKDKFIETLESIFKKTLNNSPDGKSSSKENNQPLAKGYLELVPIEFGDLSALAGDHADGEDKLHEMILAWVNLTNEGNQRIMALRGQWFNACQWYYEYSKENNRLRDCFGEADEKFPFRPGPSKPPRYFDGGLKDAPDLRDIYHIRSDGFVRTSKEKSEFNTLPSYVDLAFNNKKHFPMHSWREYIIKHRESLILAGEYAKYLKSSKGETDSVDSKCQDPKIQSMGGICNLYKALLFEGVAQHHLHDSFASGHIGTPYIPAFLQEPKKSLLSFFSFHWGEALGENKELLEFIHDQLNGAGLQVGITNHTEKSWATWIAFGDGSLFIKEALYHRTRLMEVSRDSLLEVLKEASGEVLEVGVGGIQDDPKSQLAICRKWVKVFPVPFDRSYVTFKKPDEEIAKRSTQGKEEFCDDFFPATHADREHSTENLVTYENGKSPDIRFGDLPRFEGWKVFFGVFGQTFGKLSTLNSDGTLRDDRSHTTKVSLDVGRVQTIDDFPINYIGIGGSIVPKARTSVYLSIGKWWFPFDNENLFVGLRGNPGFRLVEGFTEENPDATSTASFEFTVPVDIGGRLMKSPFNWFVRFDVINMVFTGFTEEGQKSRVVTDSPINGNISIVLGFGLDITGLGGK